MAKESKIQWTDHTFNPWWGCEEVSPGCAHCYAKAWAKRCGQALWGARAPRRFFGDKHWAEPLKWDREAGRLEQAWLLHVELCRQSGIDRTGAERYWIEAGEQPWHRPRVFVASMADVFEDREDLVSSRLRLFELIAATPHLDWLLLTKRPQNWGKLVEELLLGIEASDAYRQEHPKAQAARDWLADWFVLRKPPANVWVGTTVEDQKRADERIPQLLKIPAAVRFLSCEPLLEPVELSPDIGDGERGISWLDYGCTDERIDWVICGGESGPKARGFREEWALDLLGQCREGTAAFFMKQLGGVRDHRGRLEDLPVELRVREWPKSAG